MSLIERLRRIHADLERQISIESGILRPNDRRIIQLKKRKLAIKDRISLLMKGPKPIAIPV